MKQYLLLIFIALSGVIGAQVVCDYPAGVNNKLIISEVRLTSTEEGYVEITNVDTKPIQLSDYKLGRLNVWSRTGQIFDLCNDPWFTGNHDYLFLPNRVLQPGESFVITNAYDYGPRHYKKFKGRLGGIERPKQTGIYEVADKLIHIEEKIDGIYYPSDSVTTAHNDPENIKPQGDVSLLFSQPKGGTVYLEHHFADGDSAVIDQVGGIFANEGRNFENVGIDVAGVSEGLSNSIVIRKAFVKSGNIDFASGQGVGLEDSEWMPIQFPTGYNAWRDVFWTIGNHGVYELNANTLEPLNGDITVNFESKVITVPYGTMRLDDIMSNMKRKPGVAWRYDLNPVYSDSLYRSARTGDKLRVYVAGNTLQSETFSIAVKAPTKDDNFVIPIDYPTLRAPGATGRLTTRTQSGMLSWPRIAKGDNAIDTITGVGYGLDFDLRSDSLMQRLEIPENASWELVWADETARADLKDGDILKVTSESGKSKEYYIQIQSYRPNNNADLASITWPDIPVMYKGIFGWKGDTIPNFSSGNTQYRVEVPFDVDGIPALVAKTSNPNATVIVTRAQSLYGTIAERTITFAVTAEDDTIHKNYSVELYKEITPDKIEPFVAEPFISEFQNRYANVFVEIYNPGNQPIDLRNYAIGTASHADIYQPIKASPSWPNRYQNYIPGLKHVDEEMYAITPKRMLPDPSVNPILPGGGTFVLAHILDARSAYPSFDVQFANEVVSGFPNNWNERTSNTGAPFPINGNRQNYIALYKLLNDSVKEGLKPLKDPNDFEVIDVWGMPDKGYWVVGGYALKTNETGNLFIRKPEINQGNPEFAGSFGTNEDDCEWIRVQPNIDFAHMVTADRYAAAVSSLNQHYMIPPTFYKSTVSSTVYKVSDGYGANQKIEGIRLGTTVGQLLADINKDDDGQTIKCISSADNSEMDLSGVLAMNDRLEVTSADGQNSTIYRLDVTPEGLSNNAYLTSNRWNIQVTSDPKSAGDENLKNGEGIVSGFDYGTTIKTIVDNINVPSGATLTVIDGNGAYVPFITLNFDTAYVSVTVNPDIYLDVIAEDNSTRMVYQLQPSTSENDAFILSDLYEVLQTENLINHVPRGTNFNSFLNNIIPSLGASLKLLDKMGFERKFGNIREDDKVVVTSANGEVTRVYFISFLPTSTIPETLYLAYVLSEAYSVDQVDHKISEGLAELTGQTLVDEFLSYIIPSEGATITLVDKNGDEKTSGDLDDGDILKVTSANGKLVTIYTLDLDLTSADQIGLGSGITIYPNPATQNLNIRGVNSNNFIRIYSLSGALLREFKAKGDLEIISLESIPSGIFMILIEEDSKIVGRFKGIKQ